MTKADAFLYALILWSAAITPFFYGMRDESRGTQVPIASVTTAVVGSLILYLESNALGPILFGGGLSLLSGYVLGWFGTFFKIFFDS